MPSSYTRCHTRLNKNPLHISLHTLHYISPFEIFETFVSSLVGQIRVFEDDQDCVSLPLIRLKLKFSGLFTIL